ncbi:MAG TPA: efflux RND transporter periplasmic adaptor subunit [Thermoanaerobaculia bacterium]|nr:efflux RND transporter periplasmic adaptor subunit [Thermoanaerobaculia bacterium]
MSLASRASALASASPTGKVAEALAAQHASGADQPRLRPELTIRRLVHAGEVSWGVKNPETLKVFNFDEGEWALISLFDGTRTRSEIQADYNAAHPGGGIPLATVLDFEETLRKMELLEQKGAERNLALLEKLRTARQRKAEEKEEGFNIFLIPFHVMDPNELLNKTVRWVRWLWSPPVVTAGIAIFLLTASVFVARFSTIWTQTLELYHFLGKPFWDFVQFFVIMTAIGAVHEFGHAFAIKIYGGDVHDIGFALFYMTPAYYCDSTDAYLFTNRWHRLWVALGGIYVECYICAIATGLWVVSYPDTLVHELAYKTMLYTGVSTVFFNINPMVKTDGYHVLSSFLDLPQLREESFQYVGALIQHYLLRLPVEVPVLSRRKRRIYLIYAPLALAYTAMIMWLIGQLFYNLYGHLSAELAGVLATVTFVWVFRKRARVFTHTLRMFYLDKKEYLVSPKIRRRLLAAAALLLILLALPIFREPVTADVTLAPARLARIEAPQAGFVSRVLARENDPVRPGQPIFGMTSPEVQVAVASASSRAEAYSGAEAVGRAEGDTHAAFVAGEKARAAEASLTAAEGRARLLTVTSPERGRILTPRIQDLEGRFVEKGTLLAEVGSLQALSASIPVSERLIGDVAPGQAVSLHLPSRPYSTVRGEIVSVAPAAASYGSPAAVRASLLPSDVPDRFIAIARFPNSGGDLIPGMAGEARIYTRRRSYLGRAGRVVWHWMRTVVW